MSKQLLIYENVVPITKSRHADWHVEVGHDFGFTRNLNFVPILTAEFAKSMREYPVVFSKAKDAVQPVAILGMRGEENFYLNDSNEWTAKYIPAFLRRYPFVFSQSEDGSTFTLCIDESFSGFNQEKKGEPLLSESGEPSPYVNGILRFLQGFQNEYQRTQDFCRKLEEFDLLQPQSAVWTGPEGQKNTLTGFHCIDREKLKNLPSKVLTGMVSSGEMDLVYAHLLSLESFDSFKDKLAQGSDKQAAPSA